MSTGLKEVLLLGHVFCGVCCAFSTIGCFVEVLNANPGNLTRIHWMSRACCLFMWMAFLLGGYWYVVDYKADKSLILQGPWPFAHNFFMETKEHFVITLLLAATYLPIAAAGDLASNQAARRLVLWVAGMIFVLALMAEGSGAIIAMGVKMALLAQPH